MAELPNYTVVSLSLAPKIDEIPPCLKNSAYSFKGNWRANSKNEKAET